MELVNLIEGMALLRTASSPGSTEVLVSLAHNGDAAYRNNLDLVLRRESANANELWQADDR